MHRGNKLALSGAPGSVLISLAQSLALATGHGSRTYLALYFSIQLLSSIPYAIQVGPSGRWLYSIHKDLFAGITELGF